MNYVVPPLIRDTTASAWPRLKALDDLIAQKNQASFFEKKTNEEVSGTDVPKYQADILIAGGGLSTLLAARLARIGRKVLVVEPRRVGEAHREWNASYAELFLLCEAGLLDAQKLNSLIVARYREGICRWHQGGTYRVTGVLDCAVDAQGLLSHARERARGLGVSFLEGYQVIGERADPEGVTARLRAVDKPWGPASLCRSRVLIDARGVHSPYARADLLCPTVGGVISGLVEGPAHNQMDPQVGEILATTQGSESGRQHVWEAFPNRAGQTTVYLFYYARAHELWGTRPLAALYDRFVATLPTYKIGPARLVRPTFGLIPGWSRLSPAPRAPNPRILLVGDAAARHSPLTFCGFGAMCRSLGGIDAEVTRLLENGPRGFVDDRALHTATGALALMLASREGHPDALNKLLDSAFATLGQMGNTHFRALLQDEMTLTAFRRFLWLTSRRHPQVWGEVRRRLGILTSLRWVTNVLWAAVSGPAHAKRQKELNPRPPPAL